MTIIIPGRPKTKKNSQMIVTAKSKTGKTCYRLLQSQSYRDYEAAALRHLSTYSGPRYIGIPVEVVCYYYLPNRQGWPDLMGLYQATADILEAAGIINNDRNIITMGDTRIAGIDPTNPRTEIMITPTQAPSWFPIKS